MITWNYRVFREKEGYVVREVFYLDDGSIGGCTEHSITPNGSTLEELAQDIEDFTAALRLPVLTVEEVDAVVAAQKTPVQPDRSKNISLEALVAELDLNLPDQEVVFSDAVKQ